MLFVPHIVYGILDLVYYSPLQPFDNISKSPGKVVLLMHERMFRKGKLNNNKEVDKKDKSELEKLGEKPEALCA